MTTDTKPRRRAPPLDRCGWCRAPIPRACEGVCPHCASPAVVDGLESLETIVPRVVARILAGEADT